MLFSRKLNINLKYKDGLTIQGQLTIKSPSIIFDHEITAVLAAKELIHQNMKRTLENLAEVISDMKPEWTIEINDPETTIERDV